MVVGSDNLHFFSDIFLPVQIGFEVRGASSKAFVLQFFEIFFDLDWYSDHGSVIYDKR